MQLAIVEAAGRYPDICRTRSVFRIAIILITSWGNKSEKRWAKHRKENSLDRNGKHDPAVSMGSKPQGPDRHSHDPTLWWHFNLSGDHTRARSARRRVDGWRGFTLGAASA